MLYSPLIKKAIQICYDVHKDQKDLAGYPYIFHPYHLAEQMDTENQIIVALLHDVVEDSDYNFDDLIKLGFNDEVIDAVEALTRRKNQSYNSYIERIKLNPIAIRVKLADLEHNMDTTRFETISESDQRRLEKYKSAYERLLKCVRKR